MKSPQAPSPGAPGIDAPDLPAVDDHHPVMLLNRRAAGLRVRVACSCGLGSPEPARTVQDLTAWHRTHRRSADLEPADYETMVYGEGPAQGWTWGDWLLLNPTLDPFGIRGLS